MVKQNKRTARIRRSGRTRHTVRRLGTNRLTVFRSSNHIYAQVFTSCGAKVLVSASSLDPEIKSEKNHGGNVKSAALVGRLLAKRCMASGVTSVAFDRSGYLYHGRVKALADAARAGGIIF